MKKRSFVLDYQVSQNKMSMSHYNDDSYILLLGLLLVLLDIFIFFKFTMQWEITQISFFFIEECEVNLPLLLRSKQRVQ